MGKSDDKTNVCRVLDQKKVPYKTHVCPDAEGLSGDEIAAVLNENPEQAFKTLVTVGKTGKNYVFVVPVNKELDLKKAAKAVGEKSIEMIKSKELLPLTGYVHTFFPSFASPVPILAVVVVFPTPPFPDVITITSLISVLLYIH